MSSVQSIKAIETWYNNHRLRSRLEARWCVFFTTMGIRYEYEVDTYDLDSYGYYLPDFWLPHYKTWVEVKGALPTQKERDKLRALTEMTDSYGFLFSGQIEVPDLRDYGIEDNNTWSIVFGESSDEKHKQMRLFDDFHRRNKTNYAACAYARGKEIVGGSRWFTCISCGKPAIHIDGYKCSCGGTTTDYSHVTNLINAYRKARSARFEYEDAYKMPKIR